MGAITPMVLANMSTERNRRFSPENDAKYQHNLPIFPYGITQYLPQPQITVLTYGSKYAPPKAALKMARNVMRRAGLSAPRLDTSSYPIASTLVIELGAMMEDEFVAAVRYYGHHSCHNRWEDETNLLRGLMKCIVRACLQIQELKASDLEWVKRVIFKTDSDFIMEAVTRSWQWCQTEFPENLPEGVSKDEIVDLQFNISGLENEGVEVLFWKVQPEFMPGVYYQVAVEFDHLHKRDTPTVLELIVVIVSQSFKCKKSCSQRLEIPANLAPSWLLSTDTSRQATNSP